MEWIILLTLIIYTAMICCNKYRTPIAMLGAGSLLIFGVFTNYFDVQKAFSAFPSDIIILIIVLAAFTDIFQRIKLIDWIGYHFVRLSKANRILIMIGIPILIYTCSLFMNNLTVILLFNWMVLQFAITYKLPIVPLLVGMVIASNIGGAALPWADTPAVVLTLYTDFNLLDFIKKLFFPCMFFILSLSAYIYIWYRFFTVKCRSFSYNTMPDMDWKVVKWPLIIFLFFIISVSIGPFFSISVSYISLIFGAILLLVDKKNTIDALNDLPIMETIVFFSALFLIGGVLQYAGILSMLAGYLLSFANGNAVWITLTILCIAFFIATFLSAGPAAATLLPICLELSPVVPDKLIYAALALGILAGSSMLPWSATGGPILLSETNTFLNKKEIDEAEDRERIMEIFSLKRYLKFSVPFSLFILIGSAVYLYVYLMIVL